MPMSDAAKPNAIEVSGLSVVFGEGAARNVAVDGVSFTVPAGGSFGLVGESGSGKTTVIRAIAGLIQDWSGAIAIAGRDLGRRRERGFYRTVQMVFQDPYASLHPRHTVDRTLSEPLVLHGFDRVEERIEEGLDAVGLGPDFRFRYPHQLSGGQRQRVAIARALMLQPDILLLDEPTSALDVTVQMRVLQILDRLVRERGMGLIFISHDLNLVSTFCDRVLIMYGGRIVETCRANALHEARHPYTRALLNSLPRLDEPSHRLEVMKRDPAWLEEPSIDAYT